MTKDTFLFREFDAQTAKSWKQKIQVDLKGAAYQEILWKTNEGIDVKPFYNSEDKTIPKKSPKIAFNICQSFYISDAKKINTLAKHALQNGVNTLLFIASEKFDIETLFKNIIETQNIEFQFQLQFLDTAFYKKLSTYLEAHNISLNIDIIGNLAKTGNWFTSLKDDHHKLTQILKNRQKKHTVIAVDTTIYQNAGANNVQQIAYALAHANEYLNHFGKAIANNIQFQFATGGNYFFEIAKLKAFRLCWKALLSSYETTSEATLFSQPSQRNKTLYDYNVNMLRTTTECMSAILGGANTVCNTAYDALYHKKNAFGERIAKNQLLIIQEESYFKNAATFTDGAYYIESLTDQLAEKALNVFKSIEANGGFLKQLKAGTVQRKIAESAHKEQKLFDENKLILLGTNKHTNAHDKMKADLELYPFTRKNPTKTLIQPILAKRLAEKLEQERLKKEDA